jgi:hypothetical protein
MDVEKHKRIEQRAYAVWQSEGQPHGKHDEHWRRAALQIDAEENGHIAAKTAEQSKERRSPKQGAAKPGRKKSKN